MLRKYIIGLFFMGLFFLLGSFLNNFDDFNFYIRKLVMRSIYETMYPLIYSLHLIYEPHITAYRAILIACIMIFFKKKLLGGIFLITMSMQTFVVVHLKNFFQNERPAQEIFGVYEISYSYPSGHATFSLLFALFISYFLFVRFNAKLKYLISGGYFLLAIMTAYCRLYLDVHWFTDLVGSWFLAMGEFFLAIAAYEMIKLFYEKNKNKA